MEIDQARLLTLNAAWMMDTEGKREARQEISMIKVVAANVVMDVLDRAIQVHGSLGMSDDTPLAAMWRYSRMLQGRRRPRRGPQDGHRPARAEPLQLTSALRALTSPLNLRRRALPIADQAAADEPVAAPSREGEQLISLPVRGRPLPVAVETLAVGFEDQT